MVCILYLSDRRQCVKINETLSDEQPINQGVPQGSILGPLSFLLSVNDLPLQDALKNLDLFADDATVSAHGTDIINTVETQLQTKLHNIANWCIDNSMVLGINKTKCMLLGTRQKLRYIEDPEKCLNLKIQDQKIEQVTSEILLGIHIDNCLTWNDQIKKVKNSAKFKISLLKKIKLYLPQKTRKLFFNYYTKPHPNYCNSIWGQTSQENLSTITRLQKQAARLILDKDYNTTSEELFKKLDWQTFPESVQYQQALLVYKSLNSLAPPYMAGMFQYVKDTKRNNLRSATNDKLFVPRVHPKTICYLGLHTTTWCPEWSF